MDRLPNDFLRPILRVVDRLGDAQVLNLRISEHLVNRINRTARHASLVQELVPVVGGLASHDLGHTRVERLAVRRTGRRRNIVCVGKQIRRACRLAEALPDRVARRRDVNVAIGSLEHTGTGASRVVVTFLPGDFALDQVACRLEVEHVNLRFDQRSRYPLALAGALAVKQREDDTVGEEQPGRGVVNRNADTDWPAACMAGN